MKNQIVIVAVLALMVSCTSKSDSKKGFEVKENLFGRNSNGYHAAINCGFCNNW